MRRVNFFLFHIEENYWFLLNWDKCVDAVL